MSFADGIGEAAARAEVVRIKRDFARGWKQRVRFKSSRSEGLEVPANAEVNGEMVGDANRILREGSIVVAVGVGG